MQLAITVFGYYYCCVSFCEQQKDVLFAYFSDIKMEHRSVCLSKKTPLTKRINTILHIHLLDSSHNFVIWLTHEINISLLLMK